MTRKLIFGLALLLMVGCQNDSLDWLDENRPNPDGSVGFRLKTDDAETETDESQTRGTPQNSLENYASVCVNVFSHTTEYNAANNDVTFFREVVLKPGEPNWEYTPPMFWPVEKKLSFFAYTSDIAFTKAGISFLPSTGVPDSIKYQVPDNVINQPDLLVSTKFNQPQVNNVSLNMKHALACVSFCGISPEENTYVKSVSLRNVYSEGALALNDASITWKTNPDSIGVTVFAAGIQDDKQLEEDPLKDNNYLMTADGYLMMIPQKLTNAAIDVLYWNGKDDKENKIITYILPVDNESYATWKPGRKYIYKFGTQSEKDITVVYYEKYADNSEIPYGLYYYDEQGTLQNTIRDEEIFEAGYGVLCEEKILNEIPVIQLAGFDAVQSGDVVELPSSSFLYPISQSGDKTFTLPKTSTPVDVYFNKSTRSCGMIVPHFARGVYPVQTPVTTHAIRTPQQMRNITLLTEPIPETYTYRQELDLDFSKKSIGGGDLTTSVVAREFRDKDVFEGNMKRIEKVNINAPTENGGLFMSNSGEIKEVMLLNSSIKATGNTGGIVGINQAKGVIRHSRIIGENDSDKKVQITGLDGYVGGIAGYNKGEIIGNTEEEVATKLPVAEVSGWVSIEGASAGTGGITGENSGKITTCLVNGVHVTGKEQRKVEKAKIEIKGVDFVGGIVGVNTMTIDGNFSTKNGAEPDVAGLVSITGTGNWVGGIAGINKGKNAKLSQVNVRLGRGQNRDEATTITGIKSVGGIAGSNIEGGVLEAGDKSFISVRGNVVINGVQDVGGIVGNNQSGNISNCFVYNFYSQTSPLVHYAPKITGGTNVGGIVGYAGNNAHITNCSVFSTVSALNDKEGDVTNAMVEVTSKNSSVGGIVGRGFSGLTLTANYVLGNVKIGGEAHNVGGIIGDNNVGTVITSVHVGNSGKEVEDIYNLFDGVNLPVRDPSMKTEGKAMTKTSGTPTVVGTEYVGGICGLNYGEIKDISMKDNVKIGTLETNYVGGIAGGNTLDAKITNCKIYNPNDNDNDNSAATVEIIGKIQVGGIVGLNNGKVSDCQLGLLEQNSHLITIKGSSALGGIAGTNGGNIHYKFEENDGKPNEGSGNENTCIERCNVYGKVLIEATGNRVGGIIGENGFTNKVIDCKVAGYTSSYTDDSHYDYDITIKGNEFVGGIAGTNYGEVSGTSPSGCKVTHTAVVGGGISGGLVGTIKSRKDNKNGYEAKLYNCDVSNGVLIFTWNNFIGVFAGQLDGVQADDKSPTLFGTGPTGPKNKIYTGPSFRLIISASDTPFCRPPTIDKLPVYGPQEPPLPSIDLPEPNARGNLWAEYQMWNYLYWEEYQ